MTTMLALTAEDVAPLYRPIYEVWSYIASDLEEAVTSCGDVLTNEGVIEACIDANRLSTMMANAEEGKAAEQLVHTLIKEHGYKHVLSFLASQWRFV